MDSYKLRQLFYYKVRHGLLQIATGITKCNDYYKLRQYNCKMISIAGPQIEITTLRRCWDSVKFRSWRIAPPAQPNK